MSEKEKERLKKRIFVATFKKAKRKPPPEATRRTQHRRIQEAKRAVPPEPLRKIKPKEKKKE